jgi:hypothetical protein
MGENCEGGPMKSINRLALLIYTASAAFSITVIVWLVNLIFWEG